MTEPTTGAQQAGEPQETAVPQPAGASEEQAAATADPTVDPTVTATEQEAEGGEQITPAAELERTQIALADRTADLQRLQAEYVNYKKRVDRDRELVKQNATYAVLSNLLPVLDDIDRADEHGELQGGFKAVSDSLTRIVTGLGLTKFGATGDEFDPNQHEALMHGHSPDVTTTTVDVVAQAGYRIGDRVVRAARVTVLDPEQDSVAEPAEPAAPTQGDS